MFYDENGVIIDWDKLKVLSNKLDQIIEIILVGSKNPQALKRYFNVEEMQSFCDYTIELVDSSY